MGEGVHGTRRFGVLQQKPGVGVGGEGRKLSRVTTGLDAQMLWVVVVGGMEWGPCLWMSFNTSKLRDGETDHFYLLSDSGESHYLL